MYGPERELPCPGCMHLLDGIDGAARHMGGLVASLSRPGGNLTGATTLAVELGQKRLELLHELVPSAKLTAVLLNPTGPNFAAVSHDLQAAARKLDLPVHLLHASTEPELDAAFAAMVELHADALVIGTDTFFNSESVRLAALALHHALPAMYQYREFAATGGLVSYSGSITDAYHVAGVYTGRILKGEKPADLPVQRATKVDCSSISRPPRRLASTCRSHYWVAPTR
jgi:putative ABC transport system substrate-binding protein